MDDFSIQLGKDKCFMLLRASLSQMREQGFNLSHQQVEVVDLVVVKRSDNSLVTNRLEGASQQLGKPVQIVSDHGSDIKKGNENFCFKHTGVVFTYDISHKSACLVKALLEKNKAWVSLLKDINITLQQVQQTELTFLRPILPRKKSRYLNIGMIINWAKNILSYKDRGDFSLIKSGYMLHPESIYKLSEKSTPPPSECQHKKLLTRIFQNKTEALDALASIYQCKVNDTQAMLINLANQRFDEKFNLFDKYRALIEDLSNMMDIIQKIQKQIKLFGLSGKSIDVIEDSIDMDELQSEKAKYIYDHLIDYLNQEQAKFKSKTDTDAYLASTDIVESIFGKYKHKLTDRLGGIYESILIIPVICSNLESQDINNAMQTYNMQHISTWFNHMRGDTSIRANRRLAFDNAS